MLIDIEIIAGKILDLLDAKGKLSLHEIKASINEPDEFIVQSLQWLIRTEFVKEDALTMEYEVNDLQQVSQEETMVRGVV